MQNRKYKFISFFALFALLISTMTPFFAVYEPEQNSNISKMAELFGGKVLICVENGFKWVNLEDLDNEKNNIPSDHFKCPLCYVSAKAPNATLSTKVAYIDSYSAFKILKITYRHYDYSPITSHITASINKRAPPHSFV